MADTIPLRYAQSLLRLAPMDRSQLAEELRQLNLPLVLLQDRAVADTRIPVDDYGRLFIHLVHKLQPDLNGRGNLQDTLQFSSYRMMFQAMLHAGTLGVAMQRAAVYFQRLQAQGETFELEVDGDAVRCHFHFAADESRAIQAPENFDMEQLNWLPGLTGHILSMAMWHRLCSWFVGNFIELDSVEIAAKPHRSRDYREVFAVAVAFGAPRDAFTFHRRYLDYPIVQGETALLEMLASYPAQLFRVEPDSNSVTPRVKQLIGTDFQRVLPSLQQVADRLHMTTPTLHRRLRDEGTSFQQLKDLCRREAAIRYLRDGSHTTAQLAELLGFSDGSTFHRAFKKWTGLTPQAYRQQHG